MDTIGDFLTRIRNAKMATHEKVDVPASKMRVNICQILQDNGYIKSFKAVKDDKQGMMRVYLKYDDGGQSSIISVERVSRPGRRVYVKAKDVPQVRQGYGIAVLSTSKGLMSNLDAAKMNVGGEWLFTVW